jgi:outer membrane protein assembly factor BamA
MDFTYLRLYQSGTFRITDKVYLGLGYMYDNHFKIVDKNLNLEADTPAVTSHWAYSKYNGFDSSQYSLGGVTLEAIYDGRDNPIAPFVGPYARVSYRENQTWLGSTQASGQLWAEFRTYISLDDILPRHLFGIWAWYSGVAHGNLPYLDLPALGYDFNGRSGRGYLQGRFRGPQMVYLEGEYRFPITKNGMLGGVIFGNFTTASRPSVTGIPDAESYDLKLFERWRPAGGVGLRIMAQKYSRTSLNIDAGISSDRQLALYFSVGEAF